MQLATYHSVIPGGAPGVAPEWIHLVPAGTFTGRDGRGPYRLENPAEVIRVSMAEGKLPLDENHATDFAMFTGQSSPAQGWIVEMQFRQAEGDAPAGIWGRIEWTPAGRELMAQSAYRGISPVFEAPDGRVTKILRAALTNTPNLKQIPTLHSQGASMDIATLRQATGLPDTADEAAVLAAVRANAQAVSSHTTQLQAITQAAGLTVTDPAQIAAQLQALRATMVPTEQVAQLQTQLAALQTERTKEKSTAWIDGQIAAGKPIGATREQMIALHMTQPEMAETLLKGMPSLHAGGMLQPRERHAEDGWDELSDSDMQACHKMGLDPKKFAEHRKRMSRQGRLESPATTEGGRA